MRHRAALFLTIASLLIAPLPAQALELALPGGAELLVEDITPAGQYALPVGPWQADGLPVQRIAGKVTRQVWRVPGSGETALLESLRARLAAAGLETVLDCATSDCGGFDFRFATEVLPPPEMQVDLADFHFLAASGPDPDSDSDADSDSGPVAVGILASPGDEAVFVQIIAVAPADAPPPLTAPAASATPGDLAAALESGGRAVLGDLEFPTGSAQLGPAEYESLVTLAAWLAADPSRRVALVGHTDAQGGLEGNITLSQRRAASVMERLATAHGVPRRQMQAEGVGWLAPMASNLTAEGREANRRVEVVLIDGE